MANRVPYLINSYSSTLLAPAWAEFAVCSVLLAARVYTTWTITHRIKLDLYLAVLTFLAASLSLGFFTVAVCYGFGQHLSLLSQVQATLAMKWAWSNTLVSLFAISFGKLSVVAFLQQIHGPKDRGKLVFLWTLGMSNFVMNTITVGTILGSCSPSAKLWDTSLLGNCDGILRNQNCAYFQGSWSAAVDLVLAIYPVIFFYNVQLQTMVKVGLCCLMGLGVFASACAVIKTIELSGLSKTSDTTFFIGKLDVWNTTEMWVILIVGCVPPIRPLLVKLLKKISSTIPSKYTTYDPSGTELRNYYASSTGPHRHRRLPSTQRFQERSVTRNDSEENMLKDDGTIVKTTNIDIAYSRQNGSSGVVG